MTSSSDPARWSDADARLLDFERSWWTHLGAKETVIRERLGLSSAAYYARLGELVEMEEAAAYDALLVRRLRRQRHSRRRRRSELRTAR